MNKPATLLLVMALIGCRERSLSEAKLEDWIGQDRSALIAHFGEPIAEIANPDGTLLLTVDAEPKGSMPFLEFPERRNVFGAIVTPGSTTSDLAKPPCLAQFSIDRQGTIHGVERDGDCVE